MPTGPTSDIVVAGHICLDLIPEIPGPERPMEEIVVPGTLVNVGPVLSATGGAVANTGIALDRLGMPVRLVGKVGKDAFGGVVLDLLRRRGGHLATHMVSDDSSATSYSIVISPPGIDRCFLHCPGANDTFRPEDVTKGHLAGAGLFHFGYPPLMKEFYSDTGANLKRLMGFARDSGLVTTLDLSYPDPASPAGKAPWEEILRAALPMVDVFLPSLDEVAQMLGVPIESGGDALLDAVRRIGDWLLDAGCAVAVIKLGSDGLYLRSGDKAGERLGAAWAGRELHTPCFEARFAGTTGSGDCTIAGFLASLARGLSPEECLLHATGVGAFSVEAPDATGGVPSWDRLEERIAQGWRKGPLAPAFATMKEGALPGVYTG